MSIEAKPELALGMGAWWKRKEANQLMVFAWVDDNFKTAPVQAVVDFEGKRDLDSCSDYWNMVDRVRDAAGGIYIDSSSIMMESVRGIATYIMLKASSEKEMMAQIKKDKIEKLKKELADLEQP